MTRTQDAEDWREARREQQDEARQASARGLGTEAVGQQFFTERDREWMPTLADMQRAAGLGDPDGRWNSDAPEVVRDAKGRIVNWESPDYMSAYDATYSRAVEREFERRFGVKDTWDPVHHGRQFSARKAADQRRELVRAKHLTCVMCGGPLLAGPSTGRRKADADFLRDIAPVGAPMSAEEAKRRLTGHKRSDAETCSPRCRKAKSRAEAKARAEGRMPPRTTDCETCWQPLTPDHECRCDCGVLLSEHPAIEVRAKGVHHDLVPVPTRHRYAWQIEVSMDPYRYRDALTEAILAVWAIPMPADYPDERDWREGQAVSLILVWRDERVSAAPNLTRFRRRLRAYVRHMESLSANEPEYKVKASRERAQRTITRMSRQEGLAALATPRGETK